MKYLGSSGHSCDKRYFLNNESICDSLAQSLQDLTVFDLVDRGGLEPPTSSLQMKCSTR